MWSMGPKAFLMSWYKVRVIIYKFGTFERNDDHLYMSCDLSLHKNKKLCSCLIDRGINCLTKISWLIWVHGSPLMDNFPNINPQQL